MRAYLDVAVVVSATLGAVLVIALGATGNIAAVVLGSLLVLALPGYAATAAMFPPPRLNTPERALLSVGLSLTTSALGGLLLNVTPWGLRPWTWAILLATVTILGSAVALLRRRFGARFAIPSLAAVASSLVRFGMAGGILASAVAIAVVGATTDPSGRVTLLWIVPAQDSNSAVIVGIRTSDHAAEYRLELSRGGQTLESWAPIALQPGEAWVKEVDVARAGSGQPVEARLYRVYAPEEVYREARVWLGDGSGG